MKILYGTANEAKLQHMKKILEGLNIEIYGLGDLNIPLAKPEEGGKNPLENARIKALHYYKETGAPVFSCDSGLFLEGVEEQLQPGVHVRRVNGRELTDDEMIGHYSSLAQQHGGRLKAKYINAIALVVDENNIFTHDGDDLASEEFIISATPHSYRKEGFPLDSLSVELTTDQYYYDITNIKESKYGLNQGFREFFRMVEKKICSK